MVSIKLEGTTSLQKGDGIVARLAEAPGRSPGWATSPHSPSTASSSSARPPRPWRAGRGREHAPADGRSREPSRLWASPVRSLRSSHPAGWGRIQPHANAGFECWSKGVDVVTDATRTTTVTARHQIQYAAGVELEATPKLTLIVDFLGQHIRGAGQVGFVTDTPPANPLGVTSTNRWSRLAEGIQKITFGTRA